MRQILTVFVALLACTSLSACGAVIFGESTQNSAQNENNAQQEQQEQLALDCDALMQKLADSCFAVTAFEEDGKTPLHMTDEAGNDLGEVDQNWAADYCECYAQMAFQTFGCETVSAHQTLSDEEYDKLYEPVIAACSEPQNNSTENIDPAAADPSSAENATTEQPTADTATPVQSTSENTTTEQPAADSAAATQPAETVSP